jgi:hypothetical protein
VNRLSQITGATKHEVPRPTAAAGAPSRGTPSWLDAEARALLASIVANAPEQSRPLTQTFCGIASYGFAGKEASRLREIYGAHYSLMLDFVGAVPFGTPAYHARRDALIAYDNRWNADAVIERALASALRRGM